MTNKADNNMTFTKEIFSLISENKRFPAYQAERRIDIFINLFLEDILKFYDPKAEYKFIAPEFPLKKEAGNQSTNVDYLCLRTRENLQTIICVELKTDASSFDPVQFKTYIEHKNSKTWKDCVVGLVEIASSKGMRFEKRKKYYHLIKSLYEKGLLQFNQEYFKVLDEMIFDEKNQKGDIVKLKYGFTKNLKDMLSGIGFPDSPTKIEIVYLAPENLQYETGFDAKQVKLIPLDLLSDQISTKYPEEWKLLKGIVFDQ